MRTFWRTSSSVTKENCYLQNSDKEVSKIEKPQCSQNNPSALPLRQTVTFLYNSWNTYKELVSHISRIVSSALQIFTKPERKQKQHTHTAAEPGRLRHVCCVWASPLKSGASLCHRLARHTMPIIIIVLCLVSCALIKIQMRHMLVN